MCCRGRSPGQCRDLSLLWRAPLALVCGMRSPGGKPKGLCSVRGPQARGRLDG